MIGIKTILFFSTLVLPQVIVSIKPGNEKRIIEIRAAQSTDPAKFNSVLFEQSVKNKMKNLSKGYAFAVGDKEGIKGDTDNLDSMAAKVFSHSGNTSLV